MESLDLLAVELLLVVMLFVGASRALVHWTAQDKKD